MGTCEDLKDKKLPRRELEDLDFHLLKNLQEKKHQEKEKELLWKRNEKQ